MFKIERKGNNFNFEIGKVFKYQTDKFKINNTYKTEEVLRIRKDVLHVLKLLLYYSMGLFITKYIELVVYLIGRKI